MATAGFDIRRGRCGRRVRYASSAGIVATGQAIDTTSGYYQAVDSVVLDGTFTTGFYRWMLIYIPAGMTNPGASEVLWCHRGASGTRGWNIRLTSSGTIDCYAADGFPSYVFSAAYTIQAADKGKWHLLHMVASASSTNIRLYFDATDIGVVGTWGGYTGPTSGDALTVGALSGGANAVTKLRIGAFGGADGSLLTQQQVVEHYNAIEAAGTGVACGVGTEYWWNVDSNPAADDAWLEESAAETLDKVGTVTVEDPVFDMTPLAYANTGRASPVGYFTKTTSSLLIGSTSMTVYFSGVPAQKSATAWTSGNNYILHKTAAGVVRGFASGTINSGKPYLFTTFANGAGTGVNSRLLDASTVANNALLTCAFTLGADEIIAYLQGAAVGTPVACVGHTTTTTADPEVIQTFSSFVNRDFQLLGWGFAGSDTATPAEVTAWHAACAASIQGFVPMGLSGEVAFDASDTPSGNWLDTTGTHTFVQTGTAIRYYPRSIWS